MSISLSCLLIFAESVFSVVQVISGVARCEAMCGKHQKC